jgi:hypothetical protein
LLDLAIGAIATLNVGDTSRSSSVSETTSRNEFLVYQLDRHNLNLLLGDLSPNFHPV